MDLNQLKQQVKYYTDEVAKNEHDLLQLTLQVNNLKRKLPENKRKLETLKRDMLAQEALQKRREMLARESQK